MRLFYNLATRRAAAGVLMLSAVASGALAAPVTDFGCWAPGEGNPYTPPTLYSGSRQGHMRLQKLGNSRWDNTDGHDLREVATMGELKVLVLLVEFSDTHFSVSTDPRQTIDDMLNKPGFDFQGASGSAYDFYNTISFGQFHPRFDVYGPVQLSRPEVDYVKTDETYTDPETGREIGVYPAGRMVEEAVKALDDSVDFSDYDTNGDGMVDFVYLFFPGKGATTGGNVNTTIWPHAFTLKSAIGTTVALDGVEINRYATSSELGSSSRLSGIGTFCHEFAHVLGLPDLYDTSNNGTTSKCFTPGSFSTMCSGNYNNNEHTPPMFSSYESYALEWMLPVEIDGGGTFTLLPISSRPMAYKIAAPGKPQEYFLLECRARQGWDSYLQGEGMAVWHIDFNAGIWENNTPNNEPDHQRIDLVEADFILTEGSRQGDLFPGLNGVCEYLNTVEPSFITWANASTGYEIEEIVRHPDGAVTFTLISDNGRIMPGSEIAAPSARLSSVGSGSATLVWDKVEGAEEYVLAVWPAAADPRDAIASGECRHISLGDTGSVTLDDLKPATAYTAVLYACNTVNAARQEIPVTFSTRAQDFASAVTRLYPYGEDDCLRLEWDAVDGADDYLLTVAVRTPGETAQTEKTGFDNSEMPEGFSGRGTFESRNNYYGESAPSLRMSGTEGWLQTPRYPREIKSVSMWHRQRFADATARLDFYDVAENGDLRLVASASDFPAKGDNLTVDLPAGVHCLRMVYTQLATGLDLFVDDLAVSLCDGPADTPVSGYDSLPVAGTSARITGLDANTEYVAYVLPRRGDDSGLLSEVLSFIPADAPSGVDDIAADAAGSDISRIFAIDGGCVVCLDGDLDFDVYTADGRCVARGVRRSMQLPARGIYIVRAGEGAVKMIY